MDKETSKAWDKVRKWQNQRELLFVRQVTEFFRQVTEMLGWGAILFLFFGLFFTIAGGTLTTALVMGNANFTAVNDSLVVIISDSWLVANMLALLAVIMDKITKWLGVCHQGKQGE
jgi:hypothetical protein